MTLTASTAPAVQQSRPKIATAFRIVALAEAFSWLGLLIGMYFKYSSTNNPIGVEIFGPIHGGIFVLYLVITLLCIRPLKWGFGTTLLALIASIPPFFTLIFEVWAKRTGRLDRPTN